MEKEQVLARIIDKGIVAVIRAENGDKADALVEQCIKGGISAIELAFTVPFAHRVIENLARRYGGQIVLGAGTVLDSETARIAILSGADFVVSPHLDLDIVRLCNRYRKAVMAGIATVTEAVKAMECGVDILKLFPAEVFGPAFIKSIMGPLPYARIMPTGGVDVFNVGEWMAAGAVAVGAGGCLLKGDVAANAESFIKAIEKARKTA